jgi:hypothetical protein
MSSVNLVSPFGNLGSLDSEFNQLENQLSNNPNMGMGQQIALQAKLEQVMAQYSLSSTILKDLSDTKQQIIQNMKING